MSKCSFGASYKKVILRWRFIESKLIYQRTPVSSEHIAKKFNDFMIAKKMNIALTLLLETKSPGILPTNNKTTSIFKEKHPNDAMEFGDLPLHRPEEFFWEYAYEEIDGTLICNMPMVGVEF